MRQVLSKICQYDQKHTFFLQILHFFSPLNDVRAYIAWSWKTTLIMWFFFTRMISNFKYKCPPPRGYMHMHTKLKLQRYVGPSLCHCDSFIEINLNLIQVSLQSCYLVIHCAILTLVYRRGVVTTPLRIIFWPAKTLNFTIKWVQLIVGSSFPVIWAQKNLLPYPAGVGVG